MLQYPVQLPPLSLSSSKLSKDNNASLRLNNNDSSRLPVNPLRFQKDPYASRPAYASRLPSPVVPLSISTSIASSPSASSPSATSAKLPRSPYISSRQLSASPVPLINSQTGPSQPSALSQSAFPESPHLEDVLAPGDVVGEGLVLQNEVLQLVGSTLDANADVSAKEFEVVRPLGTGSYAVVYLVREVLSRPPPSEDGHMGIMGSMDFDGRATRQSEPVYGREFAIKLLSKANLDEEALAAQMSEVTIHQSLPSHPHIVTLYCTLETPSYLLLLLEYVPGEDLFYFLEQARDHYDPESHNPDGRTPPTPSLLSNLHPSQLISRTRLRLIASMFSQMCDAVATCHAHQVFHRDIKPENFIVTDGRITLPDGRTERKVIVKLTDFGLSTRDLESADMDCGSAPYMSYECRNNIAPTYSPRAADVWSLGIVLINMLYHYNPWTDTAQGACSSFDLYRRDPINFFVGRFPGMTRVVAEFLANNVFCTLENDEDDSRRITAAEFGAWVKNLPSLLGGHGMHRTVSANSTQGHPIISIPPSHRPTSRHPSNATAARGTPAMVTRSLSRAPSLGPAYEREEHSELSTVIDQEDEREDGDAEASQVEPSSRTSTAKRRDRRRGARNKSKVNQAASPTTPQDETITTLAVASQSLARELSKQSKTSTAPSSIISKTSTTSSRGFEPVSMYAIPTPLLNSRSSNAQSRRPEPTPAPPPPPAPSAPAAVPTKKPSRWKLSFGKANAPALAAAARTATPVEEPAPTQPLSDSASTTSSAHSLPVSVTVNNVTNLIMSLNAPPAAPPSNRSDDASSTRSRGRRGRDSSPGSRTAMSKSPARGLTSSSRTNLDRWPDRRSDRAISPNSNRGRPVASSASSMMSDNWRNSTSTTSSAATSTSAFTRYSNSSTRSISTTATSVSGASWRSKQPSLSSTHSSASASSATGGYTTLPKNIKLMTGVPWVLDQLPRGQYPNGKDVVYGTSAPPSAPRKQRTRKPKDLKLDTITERPPVSPKSPAERVRKDAMTSTTDLPSAAASAKDDESESVNGGGVKKVHKGQITALAKMLSALRR